MDAKAKKKGGEGRRNKEIKKRLRVLRGMDRRCTFDVDENQAQVENTCARKWSAALGSAPRRSRDHGSYTILVPAPRHPVDCSCAQKCLQSRGEAAPGRERASQKVFKREPPRVKFDIN